MDQSDLFRRIQEAERWYWALPSRRLRCTNPSCGQHGIEHTVHPRRVGPFYEWPNIRCICGAEPEIVEPITNEQIDAAKLETREIDGGKLADPMGDPQEVEPHG